MTFSLQQLADAPAILLTLSSEYDLQRDFPKSHAAVKPLLDNASGPLTYILDLTDATIDLEMLIQGANKTSREAGSTFHHPNIREVLLVSNNAALHYAAQGLQSAAFGNVKAKAFSTLDEALDYVHSQS
ncbi:MAG: hypothetical protein GXY36_18685 [Chloroflexi bacterium]|nr:hypothetical protein [Chloroflexota bacterium]